MRALASLLALSLSLAAGCGGEVLNPLGTSSSSGSGGGTGGGGADGPLLDGDCDPMVPSQCGFPFPSNVYLTSDPTTTTGRRVAFGKATLPVITGLGHIKPDTWSDSDGFSPGQAPMTDLPGATVAGLPTQDTIADSLAPDSPTILLEAETGERIPHFAELDMSAAASDGDRAFMIRPAVRLQDATRYIVAIRRVVDADGKILTPSPVFQALREGAKSPEASVGLRRKLYDDIFARLDKAGIPRADLQIAWDYTTASRENNTRALVHMRDDALSVVGADGPAYVIDSTETDPNPHIHLRIHGHMTVPLYLDQPGPGGRLVLGTDGLPKQNGTADYEFLVHVPNSATKGTPLALLQNGHGLLGSKTEGQNGYLATIADLNQFVAFGVDFVGFADEDTASVQDAIAGDIGQFRAVIDRQHQGVINSLLAMRMMKGRFAKEPMIQFNGASAIDPTRCYYRGDSQGGIFGVTYMALSTDVTRGLLGEPGMPYNLLLNRSADFAPFFDALRIVYHGGRQIQLVLGLAQMMWDRTEPDGYAPYIVHNNLPGTPAHEILIHDAIGDHQVTPLGAHILGRAVGARNLRPVNRSVFGIAEADGPFTGSGMVEWSFALPVSPLTNTPPEGATYPEDDDPHDKVRVLDAARDQTEMFLRTGTIQAFCSGVCDPM
jgi:hypothetical protein